MKNKEIIEFYKKLSEILKNITNIFKNCQKAGLSRDTFYRALNQKGEMNLETFFKIATLLKVSPEKLLSTLLNKSESLNLYANKPIIKYKIDYKILSKKFKEKVKYFKEIDMTIERLFERREKNNYNKGNITDVTFNQRHFQYVLSGKGCSLIVFLDICNLLKIDPIEIIKKITTEENRGGISSNN